MTKLEELLEFVRENPRANYEDITAAIDIDRNVAKTYVNRLKTKGFLEKRGDLFIVLKEMPVSKSGYKQGIIKEMVESYLDDFRENKVITEKLRIGELIIRLIEKL